MNTEAQRILAAAKRAVAEFTPYDIDAENHLVQIMDNQAIHHAMVEAQGAAARLGALLMIEVGSRAKGEVLT